MKNAVGSLILVPTPLDFGIEPCWPVEQVLPMATLQAAASAEHWLCENAKSLRAFLKRVDAVAPLPKPLQQIDIQELPRAMHKKGDHVGASGSAVLDVATAKQLLAPALQGGVLAFASEAGLPCVADPGSALVRAAHDLRLAVRALPGASSILQALAASGLNGQNFAFVGYLPTDAAQRALRIQQLEAIALKQGQTQLCIETPYRNQAVWQALLHTLKASTRLCSAQALCTPAETVQSLSVADWRQSKAQPEARPTVFAWGP